MTPVDPNWTRWITTNIYKHFFTVLNDNLPVYLEGQNRQTEGKKTYAEIRLNGPTVDRLSPRTFKLYISINILVAFIKATEDNLYDFDSAIGLALSSIPTSFQIMKLGDRFEDDQTELGCLKQRPEVGKEMIEVTRYGQADPTIRLQEATLEVSYEMLLTP
jgi:hypothetical protein